MLNTLKIATDGYLKRTSKAVLIMAVSGYLSFGGTPPLTENLADGYRRGNVAENVIYNKKRAELLREDEMILAVIEAFVKII